MDLTWIEKWNPLQLLAPGDCLHCSEPLCGPLCRTCASQLEPLAGKGCTRCGNPQVHRDAMECQWCRRLSLHPQNVCTLFAYRETGRAVFHKVKYEGYWKLLEIMLDQELKGFFQTIPFLQYACLTPIPESFSRKITRTFNPAGILADILSARTGLPVFNGLTVKTFHRHQVGLGYEERRKNTRNRFRVKNQPPKTVILVDDVLTTGATLEAATRALQRAGVEKTAWFTLLRRV